MIIEYDLVGDYYKIVLDSKISFMLSSKDFNEVFVRDFVDRLSREVIHLYYEDRVVSVDEAKKIVMDGVEESYNRELLGLIIDNISDSKFNVR